MRDCVHCSIAVPGCKRCDFDIDTSIVTCTTCYGDETPNESGRRCTPCEIDEYEDSSGVCIKCSDEWDNVATCQFTEGVGPELISCMGNLVPLYTFTGKFTGCGCDDYSFFEMSINADGVEEPSCTKCSSTIVDCLRCNDDGTLCEECSVPNFIDAAG